MRLEKMFDGKNIWYIMIFISFITSWQKYFLEIFENISSQLLIFLTKALEKVLVSTSER